MRILDLYCGAGGAARGYQLAGFEVIGVDVAKQPRYCGDDFIRIGAIAAMNNLKDGIPLGGKWNLADFDAIHASPPCQRWTRYNIPNRQDHPNLITPTRDFLRFFQIPYIIENVEGAPLLASTILCGSMFDPPMDIQRHRLFESNLDRRFFKHPNPCRHDLWTPRFPNRSGRPLRLTAEIGNSSIPLEDQKRLMGIDWQMTRKELSESVPPAYTQHLGAILRSYLMMHS